VFDDGFFEEMVVELVAGLTDGEAGSVLEENLYLVVGKVVGAVA